MAERLHAAGLRGSSPFTGTAVEVIHRLTGGVPRLINLLSDACLLCGFELKRKQIDQFLVEQASEDVLGLLKGPFSPGGGLGSGANGKKADARSQAATSAQPEEKPVPAGSWPEQPPLQARAAAAAESPATFGIASGLSSSATATVVAEERRGTKASPRDGNWTRSTFDVLIDALKQGRAVARE